MTTQHLSELPLWVSALLVVVLPTLLAMLGAGLIRRRVGLDRLVANNEVAGFKFAVVGVIYAVLLGFAVIVVWEKFHEAESAATHEAGAMVGLYRLSAGLYGPSGGAGRDAAVTLLRGQLKEYLDTAIEEDWPAMSKGHASPLVSARLNAIYATLLSGNVQDRSSVVLAEMFHQLDVVTQARRERLGLAGGIVPGVVWAALGLGACLTIGFTFFFGAKSFRAQVMMTGVLSALIFMGLLVIVAIDHPFTGSVSVSAEPLVAVLEEFGGGR